jgi:hypothetical protein
VTAELDISIFKFKALGVVVQVTANQEPPVDMLKEF